jgi:transposase
VTRKNAYGSRTGDAARLAARIWTVTATAEMAGLSVLTYLTAYLDACGRNGGKPLCGSGLERFLPWNAVPADLRAAAQPPLADTGTGRAHHGVAAANRSRRLSACL